MDLTPEQLRAVRIELPAKPDWFDRELEKIRTVEGLPLLRCVDGQRETCFRNGKTDIKHLFQTDEVACYVRVVTQLYYRVHLKTQKKVFFKTRDEALEADRPDLVKSVGRDVTYTVRAVGRPCWIIESLVPPSNEVPKEVWEQDRWQMIKTSRGEQRVDVLGPRPTNGRYLHCLDLLTPEGEPVTPNSAVIEEMRRRVWEFDHDRVSFEQRIRNETHASKEFERKQTDRILEAVYSDLPFGGIGLHHGVVSKPIMTVKE